MRRAVVMILTPVYYGTGILGLLLVIAFSVIFQAIKKFVQGYVELISWNPLWVLPGLLLILLYFLVYALKGFHYPDSVEQKAAAKKRGHLWGAVSAGAFLFPSILFTALYLSQMNLSEKLVDAAAETIQMAEKGMYVELLFAALGVYAIAYIDGVLSSQLKEALHSKAKKP